VSVRGRWLERKELDRAVGEVPAEYARQERELKTQLESSTETALRRMDEIDPFNNLGARALAGLVSGQGDAKLREVLRRVREERPDSRLASENFINNLGYVLLGQKKYAESIAVLRMNTEDFPKSANTWDSLGEALFKSGDVPYAVENYKKALEVDPKYENAEVARRFVAEHEPSKNQVPR
jgi:tetratricopeptide (TPR) repeat protein